MSSEALAGRGITTPYNIDDLTPFIDKIDGPPPRAFHTVLFRGQLLLDAVKSSSAAVHFPNHPGDELVLIKAGAVTLTTDSTGIAQTFYTGEWAVIPKGWVGWWRASPGEYGEFAIAHGKFFDNSAPAKGNSGLAPIAIVPSKAKGIRTLYSGSLIVEEHNLSEADRSIDQAVDEAIQVLDGALTLQTGAKEESFKAGDVVVIPRGFKGESQISHGYHALVVRFAPHT
jgi:quercetin dioxygenase-like cupin family protein